MHEKRDHFPAFRQAGIEGCRRFVDILVGQQGSAGFEQLGYSLGEWLRGVHQVRETTGFAVETQRYNDEFRNQIKSGSNTALS